MSKEAKKARAEVYKAAPKNWRYPKLYLPIKLECSAIIAHDVVKAMSSNVLSAVECYVR